MKKYIIIILLLCLCGCQEDPGKEIANPDERYLNLIEIIDEQDSYLDNSKYFDIAIDMAKINGGYRFYVTIDNPQIAMYDIEAIAVEKDVNYRKVMAANVGVFEESEYNMIPHQSNADAGFVKGLVMSGTTTNSSTTIYVLVQWKNNDLTTSNRQMFMFDVSYGE